MTERPVLPQSKHSLLDRLRGPMTLVMIAAGGFALYYSLFFERKTSYFRDRNARLVGRLGEQVRRSIASAGYSLRNATTLGDEKDYVALYRYESSLSDEQRQPQAIFQDVRFVEREGDARRYAKRDPTGFQVYFEEAQPSTDPAPRRFAYARVPLQRLINTIVGQASGDVFKTVFILDYAGNVIYQLPARAGDETEAGARIVRLKELRVPRLFETEGVLHVADLMTTSRQMAVRIGDANYQLFSVPIRSGLEVDEPAPAPSKDGPDVGMPRDTWVVCAVVPNGEFRARSLSMSGTVIACLAAAILLTFFSWPFMKTALTSAHHKVSLADVILLGISAILATSLVCLVMLDGFAFRKLERTADEQLETLAATIDKNFRVEINTALDQITALEKWLANDASVDEREARYGNLLTRVRMASPYFESVALIGSDGRQHVKWSVDRLATPLSRVGHRRYFSAPFNRDRDYLTFGGREVTIESIRSITSGQPEVAFSRRTDPRLFADRGRDLPVIALSVPNAPSVIQPVMPLDFGFAIVDENGMVLFHSRCERNTVENFFAESDDNPRVKAAIETRQTEWMNIRYWGEDHRAYVQPMAGLPWTLVTFRDKRALRALNNEALTVTGVFLGVIFGAGLLVFIGLVLILRPGYRARWIWPDPGRVAAYVELSAAYIALLVIAAMLVFVLRDADLLAFPFWFVPLVLLITYFYLQNGLRGAKKVVALVAAATCTGSLLLMFWRARSGGWDDVPLGTAAFLLLLIGTRAVLRPDDDTERRRTRERQTALPLCYVGAAFLLLVLVSAVPTTAFFKAAYAMELKSYVKLVQMQLGRDLQSRWWRIAFEFSDDRGRGKQMYRSARWGTDRRDVYSEAAFGTAVSFTDVEPPKRTVSTNGIPSFIAAILPRYSAASVKARELVADYAADWQWWWKPNGSRIELSMSNADPRREFVVSSLIPSLLPSFNGTQGVQRYTEPVALIAVGVLLILAVAFAASRFIARRVFLVDLVNPLWLSQGFLGLRHVLCHPCDEASARRLFREFKRIDLASEEGLELAKTAPQSFEDFEPAVFIDGMSYAFASGERSQLVRDLIDRLTRNGDRTVVIRPSAMNVITNAFLRGPDRESWGKALSSFVWVNGSQLVASEKRLSFSGTMTVPGLALEGTNGHSKRWRIRSLRGLYVLSGFDAYFEQFTDMRRTIERTLANETKADPYLQTLMNGLETQATGRDQLLDEMSERADEYYNALWRTCSPHEQLVLMQIAQTGLVNGKTRKDVRRLLARGLLVRDPQLRVMNETFRRFVLAQFATSELAPVIEQDLAGDAWTRFRVPFFAVIAVVMLFFFTTQRQTFDATIAMIGGLAATLPAFFRMLSGFGEKKS